MFFTFPGIKKQLIIAVCVYLGQIVIGFTLGWTAPVIPKLKDLATSPLPDLITDVQISIVGSIIYIGGLAGPYLTGYLSNVKGRKVCMLLGAISAIIGYTILAIAINLVMLLVGRFLVGFGIGIINVMGLVYLGEIASTHVRGIFLTGLGVCITFGSLCAVSVGPFVSYSVIGYVGVGLASLYFIALLWIPESPTFYALKDKESSVRNVLETLGRVDEIDKILSPNNKEDSWKDWSELFLLKGNRRALSITIILNLCMHGSGMAAVSFYATWIFQEAGSNMEPAYATIILGFTQLFGGLLTPLFIERAGRRILLLNSMAVCCLSMATLGIYFYLNHVDHLVVYRIKWLPLASLIIFYVGFDAGLGIIPSAIAGEMFEPNVRSKGCAVAITISWLTGFVVTTTFGSLMAVIGAHILFWVFSGICAFAFVYTIFFVPETKGKSLKEIREMLSK